MDFVPGPSTASYERYVSESDTDGEGDVSLGQRSQQRRPQHRVLPALVPKSPSVFTGAGSMLWGKGSEEIPGDDAVLERGGSGSYGGTRSSILSRLTASWRTTARGGLSVEELHRYRLHTDGEADQGGAAVVSRRDLREGQPTAGTQTAETAASYEDNRGQPAVGVVSRR